MDKSALVSDSTNPKKQLSVEKLDTRGMQPPEPILAILKKASALPPNSILEVRMDTLPMQLYDLLQQRGYFLIPQKESEGAVLATIRARATASH